MNVTMPAAETLEGYRLVDIGDFVINTMWAWMGALGVAKQAGIVSPAYGVYSPRQNAPFGPGFYDYLYRSNPYVMEMTRLSRGIWSSRLRIYPDVFLSMAIPVPPLGEQRAIAEYLDRETARVDTLIEEQQRLIEMLRGRRRAVVEQAVFSGLKGAPTKSNAELWLPPTPSHWRVVQLGFVSDTVAGYAFPSDGFSADEDHVRLLRGVNVKPGRVHWTDTVY
jgi:type I restriction enzyme S subunit